MTIPARPDLDAVKLHAERLLAGAGGTLVDAKWRDVLALVAWVEVCEQTFRDVVGFAACTPCGPFCSPSGQRHVDYCSWHLVQRFTPLLPPPAPR